jgi:hypothetical protein
MRMTACYAFAMSSSSSEGERVGLYGKRCFRFVKQMYVDIF